MSVLLFGVLAVGAAARLTRLVTTDAITGWARARIIGRRGPDSRLAYFVSCPWCVSVWVAAATIALGWWPAQHGTATWWWFPAALLACSYAVGALASTFDADDD